MNKNIKVSKICKWCNSPLPLNYTGPCPVCGKEGSKGTVEAKENIVVKSSLKWVSLREFYETNPKIKWVLIAITIGSPLLGLIFYGLVGVIIGLFFGFLSSWLGPHAVTKVREIMRGSS